MHPTRPTPRREEVTTEPQQSGDLVFQLKRQYRTSVLALGGALLVILGSVASGTWAVAESHATLARVTSETNRLATDLAQEQKQGEADRMAIQRIELMVRIICLRQAPDAPECLEAARGHR